MASCGWRLIEYVVVLKFCPFNSQADLFYHETLGGDREHTSLCTFDAIFSHQQLMYVSRSAPCSSQVLRLCWESDASAEGLNQSEMTFGHLSLYQNLVGKTLIVPPKRDISSLKCGPKAGYMRLLRRIG